jgi:hypothetical protein
MSLEADIKTQHLREKRREQRWRRRMKMKGEGEVKSPQLPALKDPTCIYCKRVIQGYIHELKGKYLETMGKRISSVISYMPRCDLPPGTYCGKCIRDYEKIDDGYHTTDNEYENQEGKKRYTWETTKLENGVDLEKINNPTEKQCEDAIKCNPRQLYFVKYQTYRLCMLAIKLDGSVLYCIHDQKLKNQVKMEQIAMEAIKGYPKSFRHVSNQTYKLCVEAVKRLPRNLAHVKVLEIHGTGFSVHSQEYHNLCMIAATNDKHGVAIYYAHKRTFEICMASVRKCGSTIYYIENGEQSKFPVQLTDDEKNQLRMTAVKQSGCALGNIKLENRTKEICIEAVKNDANAFQYSTYQDEELCLHGAAHYTDAILYIKNKTQEMVTRAIACNVGKYSEKHRDYLMNLKPINIQNKFADSEEDSDED